MGEVLAVEIVEHFEIALRIFDGSVGATGSHRLRPQPFVPQMRARVVFGNGFSREYPLFQ